MKRSWHALFSRKRRKAKRLLDDPAAVLTAATRASHKANQVEGARGPLAQVWNDLQTSVRLVRAWARRDYAGVGRGSLALMVGALLYFVCPIDAILDAIPGLGFLDDAAVLAWTLGQVRHELKAFRAWARRDYAGVGRGSLALMVGALLYFVCPIDAIIDAIPGLGFLDDAAVLAWTLGQVRHELNAFRAWEKQPDVLPPSAPPERALT